MRGRFGRFVGFTLLEILLSVSILIVLVTALAAVFHRTASVMARSRQAAHADRVIQGVCERLSIDIAHMQRRPELDCLFKGPDRPQPGDDSMAFFAQVGGYYPPTGSQSPLSLVAYRMSARMDEGGLERFSKGLLWNGVSTNASPLVFLPKKIVSTWPEAIDPVETSFVEVIGLDVFRMEVAFLLGGSQQIDPATGEPVDLAPMLSGCPWERRDPVRHTSVEGLRDVSGIVITLASIDPASARLLGQSDWIALKTAAGDFQEGMNWHTLPALWQDSFQKLSLPAKVRGTIRVRQRCFYLGRMAAPEL